MAQDESTTDDDAVLGEGSASQDGTPAGVPESGRHAGTPEGSTQAGTPESGAPSDASAGDTPASSHLPPAPQELDDLQVLKALAQPRRQQMLQHLTLHGPATSATLARALGLNTGATSYHLRELARYGFVEETPGPGHGRERWWRMVPGDRRFPPRSRQSAETRLVMDELNHHAYAADLELFARLQQETDADDAGEWADAFPYSRGTMRLTVAELREFFEEYIALLNRYKRPEADTPPGARTVLTRFLAFPPPVTDEAADNRKGPQTP